MNIRLLSDGDMAQAKSLWLTAFDDPPEFADWFFENRYLPQWSVGVFEGEKLISVIHGTPMELSLGPGPSYTALMTSGVATIPSERGKGHMYSAMRYLQSYAEKHGVRALFNHPQQPCAYAHLGFKPSTFTKYWYGEGNFRSGTIIPFEEEKAYVVYTSLEDRYAGFVRRDREAFRLKMADYASDGGKGFMIEEAGETVGYCVYFEKEGIYGEEVLCLTGYDPILRELQRISYGRDLCAKLPPDADAPGELRPQNVMLAPHDIWTAMERTDLPRFCVDEY